MDNKYQYCRYCSHCVCGDVWFCDEHGSTLSEKRATEPNRCEDFDFCRFAADRDGLVYRPRARRPRLDQMSLDDIK